MITQAADELRRGGDRQSVLRLLDADPTNALALALARLGRAQR
jgi:hypothetical protein